MIFGPIRTTGTYQKWKSSTWGQLGNHGVLRITRCVFVLEVLLSMKYNISLTAVCMLDFDHKPLINIILSSFYIGQVACSGLTRAFS